MKPGTTIFLLAQYILVACVSAGYRKCYGSVTGLNPTGKGGRVSASQNEVRSNLRQLQQYRNCFDQAADSYCIEASLIAGLASRESAGGATLRRGYGDGGKAWGILQCDLNSSGLPCKSCAWNSCCHVNMMVEKKLLPDIREIDRKFPSWNQNQILQGAVAAYNFGTDDVRSWERLDIGTTGHDYSNDVIARAQYLSSLGWN